MNGAKFARVLAGLAVLAVAVVAGIVSFSHIEELALARGYAPGTARLLPVSVDGLIVAASLACLTEARARGKAPHLPRAGLVLGILATLAANVAAGAHFGLVGAAVNAWPAVAFILASEILLRMLRTARDVPSAKEAAETVAAAMPTPPVAVPEAVADTVPVTPVSVPPDGPEDTPLAVPVGVVPTVPDATVPGQWQPSVLAGVPLRASRSHPSGCSPLRSNGASCPACGRSRSGCTPAPTVPVSSVTSLQRSCRRLNDGQRNSPVGVGRAILISCSIFQVLYLHVFYSKFCLRRSTAVYR